MARKHRAHKRHHKARRNPPKLFNKGNLISLAKDAGAVGAGIIAPQFALRMAPVAKFADTPVKRAVAKVLLGGGAAWAAGKFVSKRAGEMVLVGTLANLLLTDLLPKVAPQLGVGLSDAYFPEFDPYEGQGNQDALNEMAGGYGRDPELSDVPFEQYN